MAAFVLPRQEQGQGGAAYKVTAEGAHRSNVSIDLPKTMPMAQLGVQGADQNAEYRLRAIIRHHGDHYTTLGKRGHLYVGGRSTTERL